MKSARLYSLFHKIDGKFFRQTGLALRKSSAVSVFQSRLLADCFAGKSPELRAVAASYSPDELTTAAAGAALTVHDCCRLLDKQRRQTSPPA